MAVYTKKITVMVLQLLASAMYLGGTVSDLETAAFSYAGRVYLVTISLWRMCVGPLCVTIQAEHFTCQTPVPSFFAARAFCIVALIIAAFCALAAAADLCFCGPTSMRLTRFLCVIVAAVGAVATALIYCLMLVKFCAQSGMSTFTDSSVGPSLPMVSLGFVLCLVAMVVEIFAQEKSPLAFTPLGGAVTIHYQLFPVAVPVNQ